MRLSSIVILLTLWQIIEESSSMVILSPACFPFLLCFYNHHPHTTHTSQGQKKKHESTAALYILSDVLVE